MHKSTDESEVFFVPFGYLLVIGYLGFYYFNLLFAEPKGYENLNMRIIVAILGIGLILKKFWMKYIRVLVPLYWYIVLTFSLPYFFFLMLFHNPDSNIWQINGLVGMVTLTFFVDVVGYIMLAIIGVTLAYFNFVFIQHGTIPFSLIRIFGSYSAPIIYLVLFSYRRKQLFKEELLAGEKKFTTKLIKQSEELKKALSIKSDFLNNISHEVKTPINGVVNISELLVEHWAEYTAEERLKNAKIIAQSGKKLLLLMNNILDVSKFESGKMIFHMQEFDFVSITNIIVSECRELYLASTKVKLETYIQPNINFIAIVDRDRIIQVLRNLLGNAIKFTKEGLIRLYLQKHGNNIEIIVRDEGIGIPENELEIIFSPFMQSSRTKSKAGGTGLGLAICREIITAHHGKIWAVNNQGKGSSFHFLIPYNINKKQSNNQTSHSPLTIMVIDDDQICHSILGMILKAENYKMISAYGGADGLSALRKHKDEIDLVMLDLMMPDIYGINVLKEIKNDPDLKHFPVIIQSASHDKAEHKKAISFGAVNFLQKPYDRIKLCELLSKFSKQK